MSEDGLIDTHAQGTVIVQDCAILQGVILNGPLVVAAHNVTLRNCTVAGNPLP